MIACPTKTDEMVWLTDEPRAGRHPGGYPLFLLAAVNVLNVGDALLTAFLIRSGLASELNPVASVLGIPGKLFLVGTASYLLYRIRPRALIWPTLALAAVLGYIGIAGLIALNESW
jgi:hypothetical protein